MQRATRQLRDQVFRRLGLVPAVAAASLVGCALPPDTAEFDGQPTLTSLDPLPTNGATDSGALTTGTGLTRGTPPGPQSKLPEPGEIVYAPVLTTSEVAVQHPLVFTVSDAPAGARVRIDVEWPAVSWTIEAIADADGVATFDAWTGWSIAGGDVAVIRGEVEGDNGAYALVHDDLVVPAVSCLFDDVAREGDVDLLDHDQDWRVCADVPASGVCEGVWEFHEWRAHDLLVDNLADLVPEPFEVEGSCQETSIVESCCYTVRVFDPAQEDVAPPGGWGTYGYLGRPFTVAGEVCHPTPTTGTGWSTPTGIDPTLLERLPRRVRRRLAELWTHQATDEHGSVASFARLSLELMALGAPAELVMGATRAQSDEIRHAADAFAVASHFAGHPVAPGRVSLEGALADSHDVRAILVRAVLEGCLNETICASWALHSVDRVSDPHLKALLAGVATDEARHAELSWKLVAWLLQTHPELAHDAAEAFLSFDSGPRPAADPDARWLALGGQLTAQVQHDLGQEVLREVIRPAISALLLDARQAA